MNLEMERDFVSSEIPQQICESGGIFSDDDKKIFQYEHLKRRGTAGMLLSRFAEAVMRSRNCCCVK